MSDSFAESFWPEKNAFDLLFKPSIVSGLSWTSTEVLSAEIQEKIQRRAILLGIRATILQRDYLRRRDPKRRRLNLQASDARDGD